MVVASALLAQTCIIAQTCEKRYLSASYRGYNFITLAKTVIGSRGELVAAGNIRGENGLVSKFTALGSPVWSYQYTVPYTDGRYFHKDLVFKDLLMTSDSCFIATGHVLRYYYSGNALIGNILGLMIKLDRFGGVIWTRYFQSILGQDLSVNNIIETSDQDLVIYLATDNTYRQYSYGKIVRMSSTGQVRWSRLLNTDRYDAGGNGFNNKRALFQGADNSIICGDVVYKINRSNLSEGFSEGNFHFFSLNGQSGALQWETSYHYPTPDPQFVADIVHGTMLADGKYTFTTSLPLAAPSEPVASMKATRLVTDNTGHIIDKRIFTDGVAGTTTAVANITDYATGGNVMLIQSGGYSILAGIDANGAISWNRKYNNEGGLYPPNCISSAPRGFYMLSTNSASYFARLLITDPAGAIACAEENVSVTGSNADFNYPAFNVTTINNPNYTDPFEIGSVAVVRRNYDLEKTISCEEEMDCCQDFIDNFNIDSVEICKGTSFTLPDHTTVSDSGMYQVTSKSSEGCDSVTFIHLSVIPNPMDAISSPDTCMTGAAVIKLRTTAGYETYNWMGIPGSDHQWPVTKPGTYWVSIANQCGQKTDSVHVYETCEFPVYIPDAFTPNNDGLNDRFFYPLQNKNRLQRLRIYNRWGQLVFETTDPAKGWDGRLHNVMLDAGVYVYRVELTGFSGKRFTKQGRIVLIR